MNIKKGQKILVKIEKLAFGGAGVGVAVSDERLATSEQFLDLGNYKIFVEDTIPGDLVEAGFTKIKKNYAEAKLEKMIEKSLLRIMPRCEYFEICGGCKLQYLAYEDQLKFKEDHVRESLIHIGNFQNSHVLPIIGCSDQWLYRNKMEFSFGDTFDRNYALGLHAKGKRYDLINNEKCYLQSELSSKILNVCREFFRDKNISIYSFKNNTGVLRNLMIREAKNNDAVMVNLIISGEDLSDAIKKEFVDLMKSVDQKICSIILTQIISKRGQRRRVEEKVLWGKDFIEERVRMQSPRPNGSSGRAK